MSTQERLDKLENLIVSTAGTARLFNMMMFNGNSAELIQIGDLLGDMIAEVLALKQELVRATNLNTVVEGEVQHE